MKGKPLLLTLLTTTLLLAACGRPAAPPSGEGKLRVVATTTIVGDIVHQIGGEAIALTVLLPPGADPHAFEATPQDMARVAEADLLFANGAGLETFLDPLLENAGGQAELVDLSQNVPLRAFREKIAEGTPEAEAPPDPHVWTDPNNVLLWTETIEAALADADPAHADLYQQNAERYRQALRELDLWIQGEVAQVPQERRKLVTDHLFLGYFADRYGFEQIGAIIPGYTTVSSPSAQELAALEEAIRRYGVPAVFVGTTVNPALAEQVAKDTGVRLVSIYTGSLTGPDGDAPTYLDYMHYDVQAIVEALK